MGRFNRLVARNEFDAASGVVAEIALAEPGSLALLRMKGFLGLRAGRPDDARAAYDALLVRLPDDREANLNLAVIDWQAGERAAALERVRRVAVRHPDDAQVQAMLRAFSN